MRILHTADWHLGQRLLEFDRKEEHQIVLNWLIETIENEQIEVLIIAGDIFDTANPPNYALAQYYQFLRMLLKTSCEHVIIVGGNHDSPSLLNAPSDLLKNLNIHIIGSAERNDDGTINYQKEIISLNAGSNTQPKCVVAAVPFLRDRDLRFSIAGEKAEDRAKGIKKAIEQHYIDIASEIEKSTDITEVPVIATGHLYVSGSSLSDSEQDIHLGNLGQVGADIFPSIFNYVALGHLHKHQIVGKQEQIRYSGSIIPLSFSEYLDKKQVNIIAFEKNEVKEISIKEIPIPRRLLRVKGNLDEILDKLQNLPEHDNLPHWVEIIVENPQSSNALIEEQLREEGDKFTHFEILKIRIEKRNQYDALNSFTQSLEEITPEEVFQKKCEVNELSEERTQQLKLTFIELMDAMNEN